MKDTNIWRIDLQGPDRKPGVPFKFIYSTRNDEIPAFSPDGKKIAFNSDRSGTWGIWICNSDGSNPVQINTGGGRAKWSPDGQTIALDMDDVEGNSDVYVINASGGTPRRLTTDPAQDSYPSWSPDGQSVYFKSDRSGVPQLWKVPASGGAAAQITGIAARDVDMPQISPDDKYVFYSTGYPGPQSVWRLPIEGGEAKKLFDGVHTAAQWTVSRHGIYFFAKPDEKGHSDLAVYEFATSKIRKIVTVERPVTWSIAASPDGRTILYTQIDEVGSDLMLVENFR
jgi:Tol biopolymer transport system component